MHEAAEERGEPYWTYGERAPEAATKQLAAPAGLFLEAQLFENRVVPTLIVCLKVAQVYATVSDHLKKTAARMEILRILLEVLRKLVNLLAQKRDLNIGRAGVRIMSSDTLHNRRLFLSGKHVPLPYHALRNCASLV